MLSNMPRTQGLIWKVFNVISGILQVKILLIGLKKWLAFLLVCREDWEDLTAHLFHILCRLLVNSPIKWVFFHFYKGQQSKLFKMLSLPLCPPHVHCPHTWGRLWFNSFKFDQIWSNLFKLNWLCKTKSMGNTLIYLLWLPPPSLLWFWDYRSNFV